MNAQITNGLNAMRSFEFSYAALTRARIESIFISLHKKQKLFYCFRFVLFQIVKSAMSVIAFLQNVSE